MTVIIKDFSRKLNTGLRPPSMDIKRDEISYSVLLVNPGH